jgi:hypothetical protein
LENNFSGNSKTEAYQKYLKVIVSGEAKSMSWNYDGMNREETNSQFESSGLREEIFLKPDSVWINTESLKINYCYNQEWVLNEFITESLLIGFDISQNPDSIIKAKYEERKFNPYGKYLTGLKMIENTNAFLTKYIQMKETAGDISKNILANELLKSNPDFSDYFIKRIIVVEFY